MKITSLQNSLIKSVCELKKASERKKRKEFLVQGEDFISPCLNSKLAKMIFTIEDKVYDIPTYQVSKEVLAKMSIYENSLAPVIVCSFLNEENIHGQRLVYLDGVQDPGNVGSIIRTMLAFSYDGIILNDKCCSYHSPKLISATKGAIFDLPIYQNISLEQLKNMGYKIVSTALRGAEDFKNVDLNPPFVLVFGSEGQGVSENTLQLSDKIIKIKMDSMESLNVAIAAGIILERYRA